MAISKRGPLYIEHNMHCSGHVFIDACQSDNDDGIGNGGEDEVFIEDGDCDDDKTTITVVTKSVWPDRLLSIVTIIFTFVRAIAMTILILIVRARV